MPDLNSDALGIWEHLKPAIDKEIEQKTRGMVQRRKMKVTTAPSISTGTIGVTEAFGSEMVIPFATNLISATVGDMVWVEFMYGATNAFASMFASADEKDWDVAGDLTVHGVLDVTQRRCYGTLSSAGWYRVCELQYTSGSILDLSIGINSTLARKITLMFPSVALAKFVDETSVSTANNVFDKIRFTGIGGSTQKCYVDLHYNASSATNVSVFWTPTGNWTNSCVSKNLQSVADSPSGETVVALYTFSANGTGALIVNGDLSALSVLDVTQRRSYGTLSSPGWYRVMNVNTRSANSSRFAIATIVDINIGTLYWNISNGTHKISLYGAYNNAAFVGEESRGNYLLVDKVRYTYDTSGNGHIDIHYVGTGENPVWCSLAVHTPYIYQYLFVAENFTSVADSPSGETVMTEYTFAANTGWVSDSSTGSTAITLPSSWNELRFNARFGANQTYGFSGTIYKDNLTRVPERYLYSYYDGANDYHSMVIEVTNTSIAIIQWKYRGTDYLTSDTQLKVLYRS